MKGTIFEGRSAGVGHGRDSGRPGVVMKRTTVEGRSEGLDTVECRAAREAI